MFKYIHFCWLFSLLQNDYFCSLLRCVIGSLLDVVGVLLVALPVFMVHCMAGVDDAVDGLDVIELKLYGTSKYCFYI